MDRRKRIDIARWSETKGFADNKQAGVVSSVLCANIARPPIQGIIQFEEFADLQTQNTQEVSVRIGDKPVALSNAQAKIIYALSQAVTAQRGEDKLREYIEAISNNVEPKDQIICLVDIKALAKKIQPNNAKQDDIDKLAKELLNICEIVQSCKAGNFELVSPFLIPKRRIYKHTKDGTEDRRHLEAIELEFSPIFFYQLGTGFAMIPDKLFEIWGKKGTRSDLFVNLLSQLFSVYGNHHSAYEAATRKARIDNKNRKPEDIDKIVAKAQRDALMYSELSTTIQSRTTTDYASTRAQRKRFIADVESACNAIKELGLITGYKRVNAKSGERWDFFFNPDYNKAVEAELP